jgi:undecaprenyl-diphosphatase
MYELAKNGSGLIDQFGLLNPIIGIVVAGISAVISVRWMVTYLERHSLAIFGWYRLAAGTAVIVMVATGVL